MNIQKYYSIVRPVWAAEALRKQMKELLEESASLKLELSKKNQEIFKLQNKK